MTYRLSNSNCFTGTVRVDQSLCNCRGSVRLSVCLAATAEEQLQYNAGNAKFTVKERG